MGQQLQLWMPALLALFGTLIVVLFSAWLNTRALSIQMDAFRNEMKAELVALRAETKQAIAELELRLTKQLSELSHRIERLEEQRGGLVRP